MLTVSERAVEAIKSVRTDAAQALRIEVVMEGCAGLKYRMGLETQSSPGDSVLDFDGLAVFLDSKAALWLTGAAMDFVDGPDGAGFVFDNPNAAGRCSCAKG